MKLIAEIETSTFQQLILHFVASNWTCENVQQIFRWLDLKLYILFIFIFEDIALIICQLQIHWCSCMQTTKGKAFVGKIKSTCTHIGREERGLDSFLWGKQKRGFFLSEGYRFLETWAKKKKRWERNAQAVIIRYLFSYLRKIHIRMRGIPKTHRNC